jgi:transposase
MKSIGIDAHKVHCQICVQDEQGKVLMERRIKTERERLAETLASLAPARVLLESACESEWIARALEDLNLEVIVADPNYAPMYSTLSRKVKTDARDARALADACRQGTYRKAHRLSDEQRQVRQLLITRDQLVSQRSSLISLVRSLTRAEGMRLQRGEADSFWARTARQPLPGERLPGVPALLHQLACLQDSIGALEKRLELLAQTDIRVQRLMSVPGVGPITALGFLSVIDDHKRFGSAHQVESYLGLVPSESSSGEKRQRGHITKAGNSMLRRLLIQAAWSVLLSKDTKAQPLAEFFGRIASTRGRRIAVVSLARRLAGILFALLRDEKMFDPERAKAKTIRSARPYPLRRG